MMAMYDAYTPPEDYNSYKGKKFEKFKQKAKLLANGINSLSLKKGDKDKLRDELIEILESEKMTKRL